MIDFKSFVRDIDAQSLNLYDYALFTPEGIFSRHAQPCNNCANSYSVAKVFIMTALGILWDEGKFHLSDPICRYIPPIEGADPRWRDVTIEHAITHRIGFDEGFLDIDTEDASQYPSDDYLSLVLTHPLAHQPGTHAQYSDAAYYLLSRLIHVLSGEKADVFINRRLLLPLRFREAAFSRCPHDHPIGATGLYISANDMVKLGALYMQDGLWQDTRILSREWVSIAQQREFELHPLAAKYADNDLIGKWGLYGQLLVYSKEKQFAFACHAHIEDRSSQRLLECLRRL